MFMGEGTVVNVVLCEIQAAIKGWIHKPRL